MHVYREILNQSWHLVFVMSPFKSFFCLINLLIQIKLCPQQTLKGYECTKTLIATLLRGLKGFKMYKAGVALKRKIAFPRFNTMKVWKRGRTELVQICIMQSLILSLLTVSLIRERCSTQGRHKTVLKWNVCPTGSAFVHMWLVITAERTKPSSLCGCY